MSEPTIDTVTVPAKKPKREIYVALPTYANTLRRDFVESLLMLLIRQEELFPGVEFIFGTSGGDGVARTRNGLAQNWLLGTKAEKFMTIDVDIGFQAEQVARMINHDVDIVGALYPAKTLQHRWIGTELPGEVADPATGLQKVQETGTGMKVWTRKPFEAMMRAFPEIQYFCDGSPERPVKWDFFSMGVVNGRYLSEDYYIDYRCRKIGFDIYRDTKTQVTHDGHIRFPFYSNAEVFDGISVEHLFAIAEKMGNTNIRDADGLRRLVA